MYIYRCCLIFSILLLFYFSTSLQNYHQDLLFVCLHPIIEILSRLAFDMGLYAAAHANPQGAGDARPTALQIIRDESLEGQLVGKIMVITGATSGIGLETARAFSATGATLF